MASAIFQVPELDIHSGGVDLRFPHHDNEMAQSEAYYQCKNVSILLILSGLNTSFIVVI